ncbi:hypothetical protein [Mycobacterium sp. 23]|uniref:hypothetical protein n=1 Tax=Mycobacterium sp. 23 TaxID=3400424 RepID=UPI003AAED53C
MLRYFLRAEAMRDVELPSALPVAVLPVLAAKVVRYQLLTRTRWGTAYVQRWGDRSRQRVLRQYFGDQAHDVGKLPL